MTYHIFFEGYYVSTGYSFQDVAEYIAVNELTIEHESCGDNVVDIFTCMIDD